VRAIRRLDKLPPAVNGFAIQLGLSIVLARLRGGGARQLGNDSAWVGNP
jgi:hypothetical protein